MCAIAWVVDGAEYEFDGEGGDILAGVGKGDAYVIDANERMSKEAEEGARTQSLGRKGSSWRDETCCRSSVKHVEGEEDIMIHFSHRTLPF